MIKPTPIKVIDSEGIKNIFIQVNLIEWTTTVISNFSAWENLALIMEALIVTAHKCNKEGIDKNVISKEINDYLKKAFSAGTIIF